MMIAMIRGSGLGVRPPSIVTEMLLYFISIHANIV